MDGYPKTISTLTDGVLISDTIGAKETVVYSAQIYVDESVATSSDTTKVVSDQIQGTGVVNDAQDINTTLAQAMSQCISQGNNGATCINAIQSYDGDELVYDGTTDNNLRYIGANPNNYVSFNGELWRIIGVMNNIDNGSGTKETRLKIIRNESIGKYSWDSSDSTVDAGYGVNEWSQADLMTELNSGPYWNRTSGACYSGNNNTTTTCDFSSTGLTTASQSMIGTALWNTGANDGTTYIYNNIPTTASYTLERSSNNGKICTSGDYCNDRVSRITTWIGKVGLMYPSDYGYATSGGSTTIRASCLTEYLYNWDSSTVSDCKTNDWLYDRSTIQWTIMPCVSSSNATIEFNVGVDGKIGIFRSVPPPGVRPTVYLSSSAKITSGTGTSSDPYILSL